MNLVKLLPIVPILLTGCGIGGYYMEGISGSAREEYLRSIKPYLHHWEKPGMTAESRGGDSKICGSLANRDDVVFSDKKIAAARLADEPEIRTYHRLRFGWQQCMLDMGYRFTGDCRIEFKESPVSCPAR